MKDLEEMFSVLRKFRVKLNPEKCVLRVIERKFLGFMVSQRCIEANLKKIKAIFYMQPSSIVKIV